MFGAMPPDRLSFPPEEWRSYDDSTDPDPRLPGSGADDRGDLLRRRRADTISPGQLNEMVQEEIGDLTVQSLAILNNVDSHFGITYDALTQSDAWTGTFGGHMLGGPVTGSVTGTIDPDPTWSFTQGSLTVNGTPYSFSGSIDVGAGNNVSVDFTMSNTVGTMRNSIVWSQNGNAAGASMVRRDSDGNLVYTSYIQQMQNGKNPVYYQSMITVMPGPHGTAGT